jgi:hypothetical protein
VPREQSAAAPCSRSRATNPTSRDPGKRFERDARTVQSGIFAANDEPDCHHPNPSRRRGPHRQRKDPGQLCLALLDFVSGDAWGGVWSARNGTLGLANDCSLATTPPHASARPQPLLIGSASPPPPDAALSLARPAAFSFAGIASPTGVTRRAVSLLRLLRKISKR